MFNDLFIDFNSAKPKSFDKKLVGNKKKWEKLIKCSHLINQFENILFCEPVVVAYFVTIFEQIFGKNSQNKVLAQ